MYIFIGGMFPQKYYSQIVANSKGSVQNAANVLQWALINGLKKCNQYVKILSLPFVGTFYKSYKSLMINRRAFSYDGYDENIVLGFNTLPLLGLFSRYMSLKRELNRIANKKDVLIVYSIHTPFLLSAVNLKKKIKDLHICLIVPDLPQYMSESQNFLYRLCKKIDSVIIRKALCYVDSFVLLSDYMATSLNVDNRPWIRIEGVYLPSNYIPKMEKENSFVFAYTGTLDYRYGIMDLINSFMMIREKNIYLWICGRGDAEAKVKYYAEKDYRIKYFGQLIHEKTLELQYRATVLVNPRTTKGEYTKYSFPSKTIEYMASGTPCIMYELPTLPEEYKEYLFLVEDRENGLVECMKRVMSLSKKELSAKGERAKNFLANNKTPYHQAKLIIQMINQCDSVRYKN